MRDHLVLVIGDDPEKAVLALEALESAGAGDRHVHVVKDGRYAMDYFFQKAGHPQAPTPGLVLLDLKGAGLDRAEVLQRVQNDERLQGVPRIMLTISETIP